MVIQSYNQVSFSLLLLKERRIKLLFSVKNTTRSRVSFLKFARRQLRRKFGLSGDEVVEKMTLKEKLWAMCPFLNTLFPLKQTACLLCGAIERPEHEPHIKCPTPGCVGLYCTQCFADLQKLCTICRMPVEYGDLTDMSEEK